MSVIKQGVFLRPSKIIIVVIDSRLKAQCGIEVAIDKAGIVKGPGNVQWVQG
jgi:hypothetical protein